MLRIVLATMMVAAMVGLLVLPLVSAQGRPSAARSFDKPTVEPGREVVVTIAVANYGQGGGITETLPGGFTYESSSLAANEIEVTGQDVRFILQGTTSFTYTVTASSTTGSHRFSGTLRDFELDDYPVGGASSVTVEATAGPTPSAARSFDKPTVEPGREVVVTIAVANYGQGGGITETLPGGFTYESSSLAANEIEVTGQDVRFILQGTTSFTYTVTASSTTGSHRFSGTLRDFELDDYPVGGASSVTVEATAGPTPSAARSFDKPTVEPGREVVVTIAVANYGQGGGITETLPGGFTYESSSLAANEIEVTGQDVRFILQGTTSFTYTVTASSTTGSHRFSGTLRDFELEDYPVGGASSVTVEATAGPTPSATRSFDKPTVEPGREVVVTIAVANYGQGGGVTEALPGGFTYESSSLAANEIEVTGQDVRFILQGTTSFTYTVTASSTTGSHRFSGTLRDFELEDYPVGGASSVTVEAPSTPTPSTPTPSSPANRPPVFSSPAAVSVTENTTPVVTVRATDRDSQDTVTGYAINGGADSGKFSIVAATGELSFTTAPDFENPGDAGANNEYVVTVRATSGAGGRAKTSTQTIMVTVTDVVEGPALSPYDVDDSGVIEITEVTQAVKDYFDGDIVATQVLAVVKLYFDGRSS